MSRIGNKPVALPANVKVSVQANQVTVESGSNRLNITHRPEVTVRVDDSTKQVVIERKDDSRVARAMHGLTRALINNMVLGVTEGFSRELEIVGVGWNAKLQGRKVLLSVGYADAKEVNLPDGIQLDIQGNKLKITGADKQKVGQVAAEIRSKRKPEPYNGRGIKYSDEQIIRKQGKAFASGG